MVYWREKPEQRKEHGLVGSACRRHVFQSRDHLADQTLYLGTRIVASDDSACIAETTRDANCANLSECPYSRVFNFLNRHEFGPFYAMKALNETLDKRDLSETVVEGCSVACLHEITALAVERASNSSEILLVAASNSTCGVAILLGVHKCYCIFSKGSRNGVRNITSFRQKTLTQRDRHSGL